MSNDELYAVYLEQAAAATPKSIRPGRHHDDYDDGYEDDGEYDDNEYEDDFDEDDEDESVLM